MTKGRHVFFVIISGPEIKRDEKYILSDNKKSLKIFF